jgi:hypothetical protein
MLIISTLSLDYSLYADNFFHYVYTIVSFLGFPSIYVEGFGNFNDVFFVFFSLSFFTILKVYILFS